MLLKCFDALKRHRLVFAVAILIGFIYGSHHFLVPRFLDSDTESYYPITFDSAYHDETISYSARANAFYQGDFVVGDIRLFEYKDGPSWMPLLNPAIMGGLGHLFGSLENGFIASDFIFPSLIFISVYFLLYEITRRRAPALLFASLFIFSPMFGMLIPPVTALNLKLLKETLLPFLDNDMPLPFSFFEEPKITFLFYVLAAYFLLRALKRGEGVTTVIAGVAFGALFYAYLYDWASFSVALGLMFSFFLLGKDYAKAQQVFIIGCIGLLVSSFYWFNVWQVNAVYEYDDIVARIGPEISHRLRFFSVWKSYLRDIVLVFFLWFLSHEKGRVLLVYLAGFLLSYFIIVNAQVITGFNLQPDHWYRTQFLAVAISVFLAALWFFDSCIARRIEEKYYYTAIALFLAFFFAGNAYSEYAYGAAYAKEYAMPHETLARYKWLNTHTEARSVIGAFSFRDAYEISLHTHNQLFVPIGTDTAASEQEIWDRFLALAKLLDVPLPVFADAIEDPRVLRALFTHLYDTGRVFDSDFKGGGGCCALPQKVYSEKILAYVLLDRNRLQKDTPYRLDYLWVNNAEKNILSAFSIPSSFKKVYDDGEVRLYAK